MGRSWQDIRKVSQFKEKGLEDADLLWSLFDGKFSTGGDRDTPGRTEPSSMPHSAGTSINIGASNESESRISRGKEQIHVEDNEVYSNSNVGGSGKKRKKVDASEAKSDLLTKKGCSMVTSVGSHLRQKKIALEKNDAAEFMAALEDLHEDGHITMDDYLEISFKASEMSGWQKLFVSMKSNERCVAFADKVLGKH